MKLLVTGGAGFIGANFIHYWLKNHSGDPVANLDKLTYAGTLTSLKDIEKNPNYSFVKGDVGNEKQVLDLLRNFKPDVIVNFAAESHNSRAALHPGIFFETNVLGTQRLLEAARKAGGTRFHHISTCEVYGDLPLDSKEKFSEDSPYRPNTPYNASKAAADLAVRAYYKTFKLPMTISNCCNNYGLYQFPEKLIPHFITCALTGKELPLYKSSKNKREWLHVLDHCRAIELILLKGKIGETYNVGSGFEADIETIADMILKNLKLDKSYKTYVPDRPGHDRRYLLDSEKIRKELGWQPQILFGEGLRETVLWYKNNKDWWWPLLKRLEIDEEQWNAA
jgi:dTDP-glucose 4,6-dehydratase